jgi:DNA-binding NtrC family response regulator
MKKSKSYKILIVDDEIELCDTVASAFEMKGHEAVKAPNGRMALQVVKNQKVDLVLSDIRMSDGDGVELLGFIKDMNLNRPVVALMTGYADVTKEQIYEMGAEAVFEKPFKVMDLIRQVTKALDERDMRWKDKPNVLPVFKIKKEIKGAEELKIGRGGFSVQIEQTEPKIGQFVEFEIATNNKSAEQVNGYGVIRWVKKTSTVGTLCGIEFVYLEEPYRTKVLELIEKTKARTFIPKG